MTLAGLVAGVGLAMGATPLLASSLYGVSPLDRVTFAVVAALLIAAAACATYLPARRATRISAASALQARLSRRGFSRIFSGGDADYADLLRRGRGFRGSVLTGTRIIADSLTGTRITRIPLLMDMYYGVSARTGTRIARGSA